METRYADKLRDKQEQHRTLTKLLEASGFETKLCPIILGSTGGIFQLSEETLHAGAGSTRNGDQEATSEDAFA